MDKWQKALRVLGFRVSFFFQFRVCIKRAVCKTIRISRSYSSLFIMGGGGGASLLEYFRISNRIKPRLTKNKIKTIFADTCKVYKYKPHFLFKISEGYQKAENYAVFLSSF
jgi:hypothetical protein